MDDKDWMSDTYHTASTSDWDEASELRVTFVTVQRKPNGTLGLQEFGNLVVHFKNGYHNRPESIKRAYSVAWILCRSSNRNGHQPLAGVALH